MALPPSLPGLIPASFRGVGFFVPDITSTVGRRVAAHYFPGVDYSAYDDHGIGPENLTVEGMYIGDDYILRGKMLKQAFEIPGPATLMHPWWGVMQAILIEPAEITFSANELRVVRFSATFERVISSNLFPLATGPALISAGLALAQAAIVLVDSVNNKTLSRVKSDATARVAATYFSLWDNIGGTVGGAIRALLPATLPTNPLKFGNLFSTFSRSIIDMTVDAAAQSAVAPAADARISRPITTADDALNIILGAADALIAGADDLPIITDQALIAAAGGDLLGRAAELISDIDPASRKDALAIRTRATEIIDAYSNSLQSLFEEVFAGEASSLHRSSADVRLRAINDINETIGRLPQTAIITLTREADAWLIANMLYGDNPQAIEAGYHDIVSRNRLRHPAMIPAGRLEILP